MKDKVKYSMKFIRENEEVTVFECTSCGNYYYTFKGDTLEECENEINHEKINKIKLGY